MSKDTLFTNDSGAQSGAIDFVKDNFNDTSLAPTSNSGLTDNSNTNPLGLNFFNNDVPKYGSKTLFIKDIVLIEDRNKWVNNKPTYKIIWNETFPDVNGYVFGNTFVGYNGQQDQAYISLRGIGDGIGINGIIRRVAFIVNTVTGTTATAQVVVDGSNGSTIDFSAASATSNGIGVNKFNAYVHAASNETKDLHDFKLTAIQGNNLQAVGVIVYFENSGANLDFYPGTTYVDKNKVSTLSGATMAVPTVGTSLGGVHLLYKTSSAAYAVSTRSVTGIVSDATGLSGTNLLTVGTGHGSSFPIGSGVLAYFGITAYVGAVTSVSTDTLTVAPTLSFGISGSITKAWMSNATLPINASLMVLSNVIDASQFNSVSSIIFNPYGKWALWGSALQLAQLDNTASVKFTGSGFLQVDGYFSGAEIEMVGGGIFHATMYINGVPGWSINQGQSGAIRYRIFGDAGVGWNSFSIANGTSMGASLGISKIDLYSQNRNTGITFGALASIDQNQQLVSRTATNATYISLGMHRRIYSDQLNLSGTWTREAGTGYAGGARYVGQSGAVMSAQWYGKDYALIGGAAGGSLTLDGSLVPATLNAVTSVASEGFHKLVLTVASGQTATIEALDFAKAYDGLKYLGNQQLPVKTTKKIKVPVVKNYARNELTFTPNNFGTITLPEYTVSRSGNIARVRIMFTAGTLPAAVPSITLPFSIDPSYIPNSTSGVILGMYLSYAGSSTFVLTGNVAGFIFYDGTIRNEVFFAQRMGTGASGVLDKGTASGAGAGNTLPWSIEFELPVLGWSTHDEYEVVSNG